MSDLIIREAHATDAENCSELLSASFVSYVLQIMVEIRY